MLSVYLAGRAQNPPENSTTYIQVIGKFPLQPQRIYSLGGAHIDTRKDFDTPVYCYLVYNGQIDPKTVNYIQSENARSILASHLIFVPTCPVELNSGWKHEAKARGPGESVLREIVAGVSHGHFSDVSSTCVIPQH